MLLQTNIDDSLYKALSSQFNQAELDSVINKAVANYLENIEDIKDAEEILAKIKSGKEETISFEQILKDNDLED